MLEIETLDDIYRAIAAGQLDVGDAINMAYGLGYEDGFNDRDETI